MVADREMLREILIKDFDNFSDRMVSYSFKISFKVTLCSISFLKQTVMGQKVEQLLLMKTKSDKHMPLVSELPYKGHPSTYCDFSCTKS